MDLKQAIFNAESVAHLRGYEREILPLTDMVRDMYKIMEDLSKYTLENKTFHIDKLTKALDDFIEANPLDTSDQD